MTRPYGAFTSTLTVTSDPHVEVRLVRLRLRRQAIARSSGKPTAIYAVWRTPLADALLYDYQPGGGRHAEVS